MGTTVAEVVKKPRLCPLSASFANSIDLFVTSRFLVYI